MLKDRLLSELYTELVWLKDNEIDIQRFKDMIKRASRTRSEQDSRVNSLSTKQARRGKEGKGVVHQILRRGLMASF
jgi:hypothetical protein